VERSGTVAAVTAHVITEKPLAPSGELRDGAAIPDDLSPALARALFPDPQLRPETLEEFRETLDVRPRWLRCRRRRVR
jgi:hypothetical protein